MDWHVYQMNGMSVEGWRSFGVRHERIVDNRDISGLAMALSIISTIEEIRTADDKKIDWFSRFHEYWILECPCAPPIVCIRPETNPFDSGYIISPVPLPHLIAAGTWKVEWPE